jgi:hypothetical protein
MTSPSARLFRAGLKSHAAAAATEARDSSKIIEIRNRSFCYRPFISSSSIVVSPAPPKVLLSFEIAVRKK